MLTSWRLTKWRDRADILARLPCCGRILDVGGQPGRSWASGFASAFVDLNGAAGPGQTLFRGNISLPHVWEEVKAHVAHHGKFDFAICTHVLEDVACPELVCEMLGQVALRGYIVTPSKYAECAHVEGAWLGRYHHRWLFNLEKARLVAYPKIGLLALPAFAPLGAAYDSRANAELQVEWQDDVDLALAGDDYLGPNRTVAFALYRRLLDNRSTS